MLVNDDVIHASHVLSSEPIAEANHRIANSLAAVAGLVQHELARFGRSDGTVSVAEALDILAEVKARILAVARLHGAMSQQPADPSIDAGLYIQQIAGEVVTSLARPSSVTLRFAGEIGCPIDPARALHLGMIVIELTTNAIKYAHPTGVHGEIVVACRRVPAGLAVEVADDGVGLPEGFILETDGHTGLRLVRSLARQVGADVSFRNEALGLRCVIEVPLTRVTG